MSKYVKDKKCTSKLIFLNEKINWKDLYKKCQSTKYNKFLLEYRGSLLSTIFGTWKKSYHAKFVLVESISTSTIFESKSPTCTILFFADTTLFQAYFSCQSIIEKINRQFNRDNYATFPFPQLDQSPYKIA